MFQGVLFSRNRLFMSTAGSRECFALRGQAGARRKASAEVRSGERSAARVVSCGCLCFGACCLHRNRLCMSTAGPRECFAMRGTTARTSWRRRSTSRTDYVRAGAGTGSSPSRRGGADRPGSTMPSGQRSGEPLFENELRLCQQSDCRTARPVLGAAFF